MTAGWNWSVPDGAALIFTYSNVKLEAVTLETVMHKRRTAKAEMKFITLICLFFIIFFFFTLN